MRLDFLPREFAGDIEVWNRLQAEVGVPVTLVCVDDHVVDLNGFACGLGIREDDGLITTNTSRFVPHRIGPA